jgi:regulator of sigma E protease
MKALATQYWIAGILGLGLVIVVHEFGHFSACKLFNVKTPVFSVGFGRALVSMPIGQTTFQVAALPLGGYVLIDPEDLAAQSYVVKIIIMLAGIAFNFLFAGAIIMYLMHRSVSSEFESHQSTRLKHASGQMAQLLKDSGSSTGFIGPIGIVSITGRALMASIDLFLFALAILSINIGAFNLLPIPFFDGGQVAMITFEALAGPISAATLNILYVMFLALIVLLTLFLMMRDVRK